MTISVLYKSAVYTHKLKYDHTHLKQSTDLLCSTHQLVLFYYILITTKHNTCFKVLEYCSFHNFVELRLSILRCNNNKTTGKILQITKFSHRILNICRMFNLKKAIRHCTLIKPNDIYRSRTVGQLFIGKFWNLNG